MKLFSARGRRPYVAFFGGMVVLGEVLGVTVGFWGQIVGQHGFASPFDGLLVDLQRNNAARPGELRLVPVLVQRLEIVPGHGGGVVAAADPALQLVLLIGFVKAHPEGTGNFTVVARHPDVPVAAAGHVDRTRLARHGRTRAGQLRAGAGGSDGLQ